MRLFLSCSSCMLGNNSKLRLVSLDLEDNDVYSATCPEGHRIVGVLQQQRFELLFDSAMLALLDGYYGESIFSFAAALERAFEFFIKTTLHSREVPLAKIDSTWKEMSKQSERQLGAFLVSYLYLNKDSYRMLKGKMIEQRNNIIHKGKLSSKQEAMEFGNHVFDSINHILCVLREQCEKSMTMSIGAQTRKALDTAQKLGLVAGEVVPTFFRHTTSISPINRKGPNTFEEAIEYVKKTREYTMAIGRK